MDPGQIGVVIKVMNLLTGGVIAGWAGLVMMLNIASFVACDEDTVDANCCPSHLEGNLKCTDPMGFSSNFSAFIISIYMIPLGILIILYEISTKRAGAQEVRLPCRSIRRCNIWLFPRKYLKQFNPERIKQASENQNLSFSVKVSI